MTGPQYLSRVDLEALFRLDVWRRAGGETPGADGTRRNYTIETSARWQVTIWEDLDDGSPLTAEAEAEELHVAIDTALAEWSVTMTAFALAHVMLCPFCGAHLPSPWPSGYPLEPDDGRAAIAAGRCAHCSRPIGNIAVVGRRWERHCARGRYYVAGPFEDVPEDADGKPLWDREWRLYDRWRGECVDSFPTRARARNAARERNSQ